MAEIQASQSQLFFDNAPAACFTVDAHGRIEAVNPAWSALLGYSPAEVVGLHWTDLLPESQRELFRRQFEIYQAEGEFNAVELDILCKDGSRLAVTATGKVSRGVDGGIGKAACILTPASQNNPPRSPASIGSLDQYIAFHDQNSEIILLINPTNGLIEYANPGAREFYGYALDEITQMGIDQLTALNSEQVLPIIRQVITRKDHRYTSRHRLASGAVREVEVFTRLITFNERQLLCATVHDVTQHFQAEEENKRINAALRERLVALAQPVEHASEVRFEDIFKIEDIQAMQDAFASLIGLPAIITDMDGRPITLPSGAVMCDDCIHSGRVDSGESTQPEQRCTTLDAQPNHGAFIKLGDRPIANWCIGPANGLGQNMADQNEKIRQLLHLISTQLSRMAYQNIQQARVQVEHEQSNVKLARVNRLYAVVSRISRAAMEARTAQELYEKACRALIEQGQFLMAWVGLLNTTTRAITPAAWAGEESGYLAEVWFSTNDSPEGRGPLGLSIVEDRLVCCNDVEADRTMLAWREKMLARGYRSIACVPLHLNGVAIGAMALYSDEPNFFDDEEFQLLDEVGANLSFALESIVAEQRRMAAEEALQESEEKYRRLFSSGSDAVFVYPVEADGRPGRFSEVNHVACERLGYTSDELTNRSLEDINLPYNPAKVLETFHYLQQHNHLLFKATHVSKDGRTVPVEINAHMFAHHGQSYILSIARDITERKLAEEKIQRNLRRLSGLRSIDIAINTKQPLRSVLGVVLDQAIAHLEVHAARILLYHAAAKALEPAVYRGPKPDPLEEAWVALGHGLPGRVAAGRVALHGVVVSSDGPFSVCSATPLVSNGELLGVLEAFYPRHLNADQDWLDYFETLAGQAAIAIEDARLYAGLRSSNQVLSQAYDETIEGWSRALDLRDHETEGHSRRVTEMTLKLAGAMDIPEEELVHMRRGALLHDIGKVGVPDHILQKPGPLSPGEWEVMKRHPQYAFDLLSPIAFLRPALAIPHNHHEQWDGHGYPRGLNGEQIPLAARIFSVVDVWDALLSDRPYRKGWSKADVLDYIYTQSGRHFDPHVVAAFLKLME